MTTNKPEVVAYRHVNKEHPTLRGVSLLQDPSCYNELVNVEPLIRLNDYEALQTECEQLRKDAAAALSGLPDRLPMEPYQTVDRGSPHYKAGWNACRRAMLAAAPAVQGESVGEAAPMPGAKGFTMACFSADQVPVGTRLYTAPHPAEQQPTPDVAEPVVKLTNEMGVKP